MVWTAGMVPSDLTVITIGFISSGVLSDIDGPQKSKIKFYSKSHATP